MKWEDVDADAAIWTIPAVAIERALAHQDSNAVRAVYNRTQYWDGRIYFDYRRQPSATYPEGEEVANALRGFLNCPCKIFAPDRIWSR